MRTSLAALAVAALAVLATGAAPTDSESMIHEVQRLRDSLALKDSARPVLTLRLADLIFDRIGELGESSSAEPLRARAVLLYSQALSGEDGAFPPLQGRIRFKVRFQLARLYLDQGRVPLAVPLLEELAVVSELPELSREASLRLAEILEKNETPASLARAEQLYQRAIALCGESDLCSYGHYRKAWLHHRRGQADASVAEMRLALWDSRGQLREESLRDLILFESGRPGDGLAALTELEGLAQRLGREPVLLDLAEAYYAAGNKPAGTRVLERVNVRQPQLSHQIRLLEEFYAVRDWDRFRMVLEQARGAETQGSAESERILRRLAVQLDAERATRSERKAEFQDTALLYLKLYPKSDLRRRMMEGWLAAEVEPARKLERLAIWIQEAGGDAAQQLWLREARASVAQKTGDTGILVAEMAALQGVAATPDKAREYRYLQARALYGAGRLDESLTIFVELASAAGLKEPDSWAIQAQNLALDILNQGKKYAELVRQADTWLRHPVWSGSRALSGELRDMAATRDQAEFEHAVSLGKTAEGLSVFKGFCVSRRFLPKSCENAGILAVQLKDQAALIDVLRLQDRRAELAGEYEASARFGEAGILLESLAKTPKERLRAALMHELAGKLDDRDRVLRQIREALARQGMSEQDEPLYLATFKDAGMLGASDLKGRWSLASRIRIADELEASGAGTAESRKLLLSAAPGAAGGSGWSRVALDHLGRLAQAQAKIGFFGKDGGRKFEQRLRALKAFSTEGDRLMQGASAPVRAELAGLLFRSHRELGEEILKSPVPAGMSAEGVEQLQAALRSAAEPFQEKAAAYEALVGATSPGAGDTIQLKAGAASQPSPSARLAAVHADPRVQDALATLRLDPTRADALGTLRGKFAEQGLHRLASYFEGRLAGGNSP